MKTRSNRETRLVVRITKIEKGELVRRAEEAGQTLSDFVRLRVMGKGQAGDEVARIRAALEQEQHKAAEEREKRVSAEGRVMRVLALEGELETLKKRLVALEGKS